MIISFFFVSFALLFASILRMDLESALEGGKKWREVGTPTGVMGSLTVMPLT